MAEKQTATVETILEPMTAELARELTNGTPEAALLDVAGSANGLAERVQGNHIVEQILGPDLTSEQQRELLEKYRNAIKKLKELGIELMTDTEKKLMEAGEKLQLKVGELGINANVEQSLSGNLEAGLRTFEHLQRVTRQKVINAALNVGTYMATPVISAWGIFYSTYKAIKQSVK